MSQLLTTLLYAAIWLQCQVEKRLRTAYESGSDGGGVRRKIIENGGVTLVTVVVYQKTQLVQLTY